MKMTQQLSEKDGRLLLKVARENILNQFVKGHEFLGSMKAELSAPVFKENRGTFVTLHKKGALRGCIGNIEPVKTILQGVMDNSRHAAFNDSRFNPLTQEEIMDTVIEISILTCPEKLNYADARDLTARLRPQIDGVIIKKYHHQATFLPQVWEQLNDPESFLSHLCTKAGLPGDEWRNGDLEVLVYQVQSFEEQA